MTHKLVDPTDFEGKTIRHVDSRAVNITTFHFTDGTAIAIEVDYMGHGLYGMVSCVECTQSESELMGERDNVNAGDAFP